MSKHTPRKPRPSELRARAAKEAAKEAAKAQPAVKEPEKRGPGRPPEESTAFDKTTMVRMHLGDYNEFHREAVIISKLTGAPVSVGAYLRMAGRAMLGKRAGL